MMMMMMHSVMAVDFHSSHHLAVHVTKQLIKICLLFCCS